MKNLKIFFTISYVLVLISVITSCFKDVESNDKSLKVENRTQQVLIDLGLINGFYVNPTFG